jgi:predicted transcriptional regulator
MMDEYLTDLIKKEFVTEIINKKDKTYAITPKGLNFLDKYSVILDFTTSFGLN